MATTTKAALFRSYNAARGLAQQGRIDRKRLDKALGLAQRKPRSGELVYVTTLEACSCPDFQYRRGPRGGLPCKHILALALRTVP